MSSAPHVLVRVAERWSPTGRAEVRRRGLCGGGTDSAEWLCWGALGLYVMCYVFVATRLIYAGLGEQTETWVRKPSAISSRCSHIGQHSRPSEGSSGTWSDSVTESRVYMLMIHSA